MRGRKGEDKKVHQDKVARLKDNVLVVKASKRNENGCIYAQHTILPNI